MDSKKTWDVHWQKLIKKKSLFSVVAEFYRIQIISRAVKHYTDIYFKQKGVFIEAGSGTSQSSSRITRKNRFLIALDFSFLPLVQATECNYVSQGIQASIFKTPFKNNSVSGIWNLGVMEHFTEKEISLIMNEFHRVLKKNGCCILFWPPKHALPTLFLKPFEFILSLLKHKEFSFFPFAPTQPKSKKYVVELILRKTKFKKIEVFFNYLDLFTHYVVICKK